MRIGYPAAGVYGEQRFYLSSDFVESGLMGVFDTRNGNVEVVSKTEIKGGLIETMKQLEIDVIISPELQAMALKVFRERGLDVYKAEGKLLSLNVELLNGNRLTPYSVLDIYSGDSQCSPASCSSCSSTSCK